jgi:hypothetical protein
LSFVVEQLKAKGGPTDYFLSTALGAIDPKTPHVDVVFPALAPVLEYKDFRAIAVLDLANKFAQAEAVDPHPATEHLPRLRSYLSPKNLEHASYGVSAAYALAFIPGASAEKVLLEAKQHPDSDVRIEVAYALSRRGTPGGDDALIAATRDVVTSKRAVSYLKELDKEDLVPEESLEPVFAAKADMVSWLCHPNEYGRPPDLIELWDRRELYWPPTDDTRELFLFKYTYRGDPGKPPDVGVGLVGSTTFSLIGETEPPPTGTIEEALARHCVWELDNDGDPRGKGQRVEVGRKLLGFKRRHSSSARDAED